MVCKKCDYKDSKETVLFGSKLCKVCAAFAPIDAATFQKYVTEKIDWKKVDAYRKYGHYPGDRQKHGMGKKAKSGKIVSRAPIGYSLIEGHLRENTDSSKVLSLFNTFLTKNYSLNSLAKNFGLSTNGVKKILSNRTYLGEVKFAGQMHRGNHTRLISEDLFYAVQRKLKESQRKKK